MSVDLTGLSQCTPEYSPHYNHNIAQFNILVGSSMVTLRTDVWVWENIVNI